MSFLDFFKRKPKRASWTHRPAVPLVIESGVAVPPHFRLGSGKYDAILLKMEVGDSFDCPDNLEMGAIRAASGRLNIFLSVRRNSNGKGFRAWRVACSPKKGRQ